MSKFQERLEGLGFTSYGDYLRSKHWKDFRRRYRESGSPKACAVCSESKVHLHHTTYERLGSEDFGDVVPVCRDHHTAIHQWLKDNRKPVQATRKAILAISGGAVRLGKKKRVKGKKLTAAQGRAKQFYRLAMRYSPAFDYLLEDIESVADRGDHKEIARRFGIVTKTARRPGQLQRAKLEAIKRKHKLELYAAAIRSSH